MTHKAFRFTIDDAHLDKGDVDAFVTRLEALGFEVEEAMPDIGVIFASGEEAGIDAARALPGIEDAREEPEFRLPPMHESVPQ